jgi:hypothetical protein
MELDLIHKIEKVATEFGHSPKNIPFFVKQVEAIFENYGSRPNFSIAPYTSKHLKKFLLSISYEQYANNA